MGLDDLDKEKEPVYVSPTLDRIIKSLFPRNKELEAKTPAYIAAPITFIKTLGALSGAVFTYHYLTSPSEDSKQVGLAMLISLGVYICGVAADNVAQWVYDKRQSQIEKDLRRTEKARGPYPDD